MKRMALFSAAVLALGVSATCLADVTGKVTFEGERPKPKKLDMSSVKECAAKHAKPVFDNVYIIGEKGELKNVVVAIKGVPAGVTVPPPPETPAVIDQEGCVYTPRVVPMVVGQELVAKNSDDCAHNVHTLPRKNKDINIQMPTTNKEGRKLGVMKEAERFRVKCDIHAWMAMSVVVLEHPWYGLSKDDGTFAMNTAGLPDGEYTVEAWHERLGAKEMKVTIKGGKGELNFTMKTPDDADAGGERPALAVKADGSCCEK